MFDWIRRKYVALCERIEAAASRNEAAAERYKEERLALKADRPDDKAYKDQTKQ
ncbi:hypothetical protein [Mesorhizobium sp.]|uniref:hypothetical protein n=1 Tax=Mesorhizobium sp. TaxID=1871066 RepID=UPI00257D0BAA|nr:hypothetical protein [Mesorhizobium sp.]